MKKNETCENRSHLIWVNVGIGYAPYFWDGEDLCSGRFGCLIYPSKEFKNGDVPKENKGGGE